MRRDEPDNPTLNLTLILSAADTYRYKKTKSKVAEVKSFVFPTWDPFLLPGKLMMSVFPRIPQTGLSGEAKA